MDIAGVNIGMREGVIFLIALLALYMAFVFLRLRRLHRASALAAVPAVAEEGPCETAPPGMAEELLRNGLAQEVAILRDEVDVLRGELAALREDWQHEVAQMRAAQGASPLYGDAMQMAATGHDAAAIAERCGIARAEADLVVALAQRQQG